MSTTVYLVSGAARGLGLEFVAQLAARPNTVIFAGIRSFPADGALAELAAKHPEVVIPVKLSSGNEVDNAAAAKFVREKAGRVDIVIANAGRFEAFRYPLTSSGITSPQCTVANETIVELQRQLETNTFGPLILYQTFASLLGSGAKFVVISSLAGKITDAIPFSLTAYGASKAAVNYITKKLDQESPDLIAFPVHPGVVDTDMTRAAFKEVGLTMEDQGAVTPAESVAGVLKVIDAATKESHGGKFWTNDGEELSF